MLALARAPALRRPPAEDPSALRKVYRPLYVWGQLSAWFKQTINDPSASLSADGRGTVSLPSVESAFAGGKAQKYSAKVHAWTGAGACGAGLRGVTGGGLGQPRRGQPGPHPHQACCAPPCGPHPITTLPHLPPPAGPR